jgi:hypothetical protein
MPGIVASVQKPQLSLGMWYTRNKENRCHIRFRPAENALIAVLLGWWRFVEKGADEVS